MEGDFMWIKAKLLWIFINFGKFNEIFRFSYSNLTFFRNWVNFEEGGGTLPKK